MGASISPIKAEIVFSDNERKRLSQKRRLMKEGFLEEGEDIRQVVAGCGYVDDLVLLTRTLCPKCLRIFAERLYQKPLRFEIEEEGVAIGFCDKEVIVNWDLVYVLRKDANKAYTLGMAAKPAKVRYPPLLGGHDGAEKKNGELDKGGLACGDID